MSLDELAQKVRDWCQEEGVVPANGQVALDISERNIRYYRAIGLIDPPTGGNGRGFSQKHFLQLTAIRRLQARGLPLRQIRHLLYGRSMEQLQELERQAKQESGPFGVSQMGLPSGIAALSEQQWRVVNLGGDYLLVSLRGDRLPESLLRRLRRLLEDACSSIDSESVQQKET